MFRKTRRSDFKVITELSRGLYEHYGDPLFPITQASGNAMLERFLGLPYFKVHVENDEIKGWLAAADGSDQHHSAIKCISQIYYHTSLRGPQAAQVLIDFHEDLFLYATKCKYEAVITSSYLPNKEKFNTLLVASGWREFAGRLVRPTLHHPAARDGVSGGGGPHPPGPGPLTLRAESHPSRTR